MYFIRELVAVHLQLLPCKWSDNLISRPTVQTSDGHETSLDSCKGHDTKSIALLFFGAWTVKVSLCCTVVSGWYKLTISFVAGTVSSQMYDFTLHEGVDCNGNDIACYSSCPLETCVNLCRDDANCVAFLYDESVLDCCLKAYCADFILDTRNIYMRGKSHKIDQMFVFTRDLFNVF